MVNGGHNSCLDQAISELGQIQYRQLQQDPLEHGDIFSLPAHLHGAVHLTTTALVVSCVIGLKRIGKESKHC